MPWGVAVEERRGSGAGGGLAAALSALQGYRVRFAVRGGTVEVGFADRRGEFGLLYERGFGWVGVLVGPKGCGKSELVRAVARAAGLSGDLVVVVGRYDEESGVVRAEASYSARGLARLRAALAQLRAAGGPLARLAAAAGAAVAGQGVSVALQLGAAQERISSEQMGRVVRLARLLSEALGVPALAVVDEVSWNEMPEEEKVRVARLVSAAHDSFPQVLERSGAHLSLLLLASDATAVELQGMTGGVSSKASFLLMWNLPEEPFQGLYAELEEGLRRGLGLPRGPEFGLVWQLAGGNPRHLGLMAGAEWRLEAYLEEHVVRPLAEAILGYARDRLGSSDKVADLLRGEARRYVDEVGQAYTHLYDELERRNIVLRFMGWSAERITQLPRDEPWIGEWWAYQIPAYYWALKAMVERGRLGVSPREVLETIRRHIRR